MLKKKLSIQNKEKQYISPLEYADLSKNEREYWVPVNEKHEKVPLFFKIALWIAATSVIIYLITIVSESFSDFFNLYISSLFRWLLAKTTNILPFSFAEFIVLILPVLTFLLIWYLLKYRCQTPKAARTSALCILSAATLLFSCFVLCFAPGYQTTTLDKKLKIESGAVDAKELYATAKYLAEKTNTLAEKVQFKEDGASTMPYSFDTLNEKLLDAYDTFCQKQDFIYNFKSRLKPVLISEAMSYSHITGIYSFFTGEANINIDFPDYTIPYTAAHELAHQRGIAREDEANMIAFLVCIGSEDPYIQYSAYLNVYEYVSSALYSADKKLYREVRDLLHEDVYGEQVAYSKFFKKYTNSVASQVTGAVNDAYLMSQGTAGKKSYGMVVDLTVAYLKQENLIDH